MEIVDSEKYVELLRAARRPGEAKVLAFYEDRIGVACRDPRLMLLPWDDHLVHRGDGVFETLKWVDGRMYQLEPHLKRMAKSCEAIHLLPPRPWDEVGRIVMELARAAQADNGLIRLIIGRGSGGFGIDPHECPVPSLYAAAYEFKPKPEEFFEKGCTGYKTSYPAKQSYMACIKSVNYLPNALMKREAVDKGFDYPFCFDSNGFLAEGATENVCMVRADGTLVIPEFTCALAGTTIMRAIDLIKGDIPITFRGIVEDELFLAKEIIVIGTTIDAVSVVRYEGKPIHDVRPGPVSRRLRRLLKEDLARNGESV